MKNTPLKSHLGNTRFKSKRLLTLLAPFVLAQPALSAITVHFVEEGSDVRVSFSGSIDLTGAPGTDTTRQIARDTDGIGSVYVVRGGGGYFEIGVGDDPNGLTPVFMVTYASPSGSRTISESAFGYFDTSLFYDARHISGGSVGNVTELTADPSLDTFLVPNETLASLNAGPGDITEGATLWTSNGTAGDTFVFSRNPAPIPEPSVGLLSGLAALGLLRRRR